MASIAFPMSYTAPLVTARQLESELLALTPEQAYAIKCEQRGICALPRETPEMREQGLRDLEKALQTITNKAEYLQALEVAPSVAQSESNPLFFLRCEGYNAIAAATRLTKYWSVRCKVFGDRAFLPLTQTGNDALTHQDVEELRKGSMQLLEPDDMGRAVILFRRSPIDHTGMQRSILLRIFMYLCAVICKDPVRQRHGYVFIIDTLGCASENSDRKASRMMVEAKRDVLPIRVRCVHLCYPEMKCVAKLFLPTLLWIMGPELRLRVCTHYGSPKELSFDLNAHGIDRQNLPAAVGGDLVLEKWLEFLDQRRAEEIASQDIDIWGQRV